MSGACGGTAGRRTCSVFVLFFFGFVFFLREVTKGCRQSFGVCGVVWSCSLSSLLSCFVPKRTLASKVGFVRVETENVAVHSGVNDSTRVRDAATSSRVFFLLLGADRRGGGGTTRELNERAERCLRREEKREKTCARYVWEGATVSEMWGMRRRVNDISLSHTLSLTWCGVGVRRVNRVFASFRWVKDDTPSIDPSSAAEPDEESERGAKPTVQKPLAWCHRCALLFD